MSVYGSVPSQVASTWLMNTSGSPVAATNDGPARTDFKNARTGSSPLLSESSDTSTRSTAPPAVAAMRPGSSFWHGSHQVAQKLTTSVRPLCAATTLRAYASARSTSSGGAPDTVPATSST